MRFVRRQGRFTGSCCEAGGGVRADDRDRGLARGAARRAVPGARGMHHASANSITGSHRIGKFTEFAT